MDILKASLEEIALDGLEGCTFPALVEHLERRSSYSSSSLMAIDDYVKSFLWKGLLDCDEVKIYLLDKDYRPQEITKEGNDYKGKKKAGEGDILPCHWIYEKDKNICGYSPSYSNRTDISEDVSELDLDEAYNRYGNRLILVASQDLRFRTLVGETYSPEMTASLNSVRYIILEIIGKTRNQGFIQMDLKKYHFDPRTSFHHIKILLQNDLVTKQSRILTIVPGRLLRTKLLFLKGFHRQSLKKSSVLAGEICTVLAGAPDSILELRDLKSQMKAEGLAAVAIKQFKRARQWLYSNGYIQYICDGKVIRGESPMLRASKKIFVQLVKMYEPEPDEEEKEDEVEDDLVTRYSSADPLLLNELTLEQHSYLLLTSVREEGLTTNDLAEKACIPHFWARSFLQTLHSMDYCSTIMLSKEKQRHKKVVSYLFLHDNKTVKTLRTLIDTPAENKTTEGAATNEESEPGTSGSHSLVTVGEMLPDVDGSNSAVGSALGKPNEVERSMKNTMKLESPSSQSRRRLTCGDGLENTSNKLSAVKENMKLAESLNLREYRYRKPTSESRLCGKAVEREKFLIDTLKSAKIVTNHVQLYKALVKEEADKGLLETCCRKSFRRLMARLEESRMINVFRIEVSELPQKQLTIYCPSGVDKDDEAVKNAVDQARFRAMHTKKVTKKKKVPEVKKEPTDETTCSQNQEPKPGQQSEMEVDTEVETDTEDETSTQLNEDDDERGFRPLARFSRLKHLHLFLWQLLYGERNEDGHTVFKVDDAKLSFQEKIGDFDFLKITRRMPVDEKGPGWFKVGDLLSILPLSLFGECGGVRVQSKTFDKFMNDPKKRMMIFSEYPPKLTTKLLNAKEKGRILVSVISSLVIMVQLGLVRVRSDTLPINRLESMLYLTKETVLQDTTRSKNGYCEVSLPPDLDAFPTRHFKLDSLSSIFKYWSDLHFICLNTPLGHKSHSKRSGLPKKRSDNPFSTLRDFKKYFTTDNLAQEEPRLIGDGRGAGGLESMLFSHLNRNWHFERPRASQNAKRETPAAAVPALKEDFSFARPATVKKLKILKRKILNRKDKDPKKKKLGQSAAGKGALSSKSNKKLESVVANRLLAYHQRQEALKRMKGKKKKEAKGLDELDQNAYGKRRSLRSVYSAREDAMILHGIVAANCMRLNCKTYNPWELVRNIMHVEFEESRDKTLVSIQRRSRKLMKYPDKTAVMKACVVECYDHEGFSSARNFNVSNWKKLFEEVFLKVREKYKGQISPEPAILAFPTSLDECNREFIVKGLSESKPLLQPPKSLSDINKIMLRDLIHNCIGARQSPGFVSSVVYELFTSYSQEEVDRVVAEMRRRGLITRVRYDIPRHRVAPISMLRYDLSTRCDRLFGNLVPPKVYATARQVRKGSISLLEFESGLCDSIDERACSLPCYRLEKGFFSHDQDNANGGIIAFFLSLLARNEAIVQVVLPDRTLYDTRDVDEGRPDNPNTKVQSETENDDLINTNDEIMTPIRVGIKRKREDPDLDMEDGKKICTLKRASCADAPINILSGYLETGKITHFRRTCVDQSHVDFVYRKSNKGSASHADHDIYKEYEPIRKYVSHVNGMLLKANKEGSSMKHPSVKQDDFILVPFGVKFKEDIKPFYEYQSSSFASSGDEIGFGQDDNSSGNTISEQDGRECDAPTEKKIVKVHKAISPSFSVRDAEYDSSVVSRFMDSADVIPSKIKNARISEREIDEASYGNAVRALYGFTASEVALNMELYNVIKDERELGATADALMSFYGSRSCMHGEHSLELHLRQLINFEKIMEAGAVEKRYVAWEFRWIWCIQTPLLTMKQLDYVSGFRSQEGPSNESYPPTVIGDNEETAQEEGDSVDKSDGANATRKRLVEVLPESSSEASASQVEDCTERDKALDARQDSTVKPPSEREHMNEDEGKRERKGQEEQEREGIKAEVMNVEDHPMFDREFLKERGNTDKMYRITRLRPWLGLGGELSPFLLKRIQLAVLSYISFHPGVYKKTIVSKFSFIMRPVAVEDVLQCLVLNKSITEHFLVEKKPQRGPFSKSGYHVDYSNPYYLPTMSCFFNMVDVDRK